MRQQLLLTFLISVMTQFLLYHYWGKEGFHTSLWFISLELITIWYLLSIHLLPLLRRKQLEKMENVIDLNQYRKKREKEKKHTQKVEQQFKNLDTKNSDNWEILYSSTDQIKVDLIYSLLRKNNITCQIIHRHAASIFPTVGGISLKLLVKKEQVSRANQILQSHEIG